MKIGEVSKLTCTTVNVIRYYINTGLLVPKSKNKQYVFGADDLEDLQEILKLKGMMFSLADIHKIISFRRVTNLADRGDINDYLRFFENQKDCLVARRKELDHVISGIKQEIELVRNTIEKPGVQTGVPVNMLHLICCPACGKQLNISDARIESRYIISGSLLCECGYSAKIVDGILCTFGGYISKYDYPDTERSFYKNIPAPFISLLQKSYNWLLDELVRAKPCKKVIFEDHMNAYFFSYRHIELMEKDASYIMADKYFEIVKMYKERIDRLGLDLDILYIADATFELPLRHGCVDIYIDYFSSNEFNFFNYSYLWDSVGKLFHSGTRVLGTYFYFKERGGSMKQMMLDYPETWLKNFHVSEFKNHFLTYEDAYSIIADEEVGSVNDTGNCEAFSFHEPGEDMHLYSYHWCKK